MQVRRSMWLTILWGWLAFTPPLAFAQKKPSIAGDYVGSLGPLHLKLHLKTGAGGALSGSLDSPDQGASNIECSDFHFDGQSLSFTVLAVNGAWKGTVGKQGAVLTGTWNQGTPVPLNFSRDTFLPAAKPLCRGQDMAGDAGGWPAIVANPADGKTLTGTWTQGQPLPLNFERQAAASLLPPTPPVTYDAAMAPVPAAELQAVLSKDLAQALTSGALATIIARDDHLHGIATGCD